MLTHFVTLDTALERRHVSRLHGGNKTWQPSTAETLFLPPTVKKEQPPREPDVYLRTGRAACTREKEEHTRNTLRRDDIIHWRWGWGSFHFSAESSGPNQGADRVGGNTSTLLPQSIWNYVPLTILWHRTMFEDISLSAYSNQGGCATQIGNPIKFTSLPGALFSLLVLTAPLRTVQQVFARILRVQSRAQADGGRRSSAHVRGWNDRDTHSLRHHSTGTARTAESTTDLILL